MSAQDREQLVERVFPAELDQLAGISAFAMDQAEALGMDDQGLFAVQMAVDEAATNVIIHGYQERGMEGEVRLLCWKERGSFVVQLRDHSPPFNSNEVPDPDLNTSLEKRQEGGLGIFLMRRLMDRVEFAREGDENVLTMARRLCSSTDTAVDVEVVFPQGRIDAARAPYLEQLFRQPLSSGTSHLVVDLSQVTYLSSSGLRILLIVAKQLREQAGRLALCCPRPGVARVLDITGFTEIIPLYETRDAALSALEGMGESET